MDDVDREYPWMTEIQKAIMEISLVYCLNSRDLLVFLTSTLCGQFVVAGLSEEKVKQTLDRMLEKYREIKKREDGVG